MIQWIWTLLQKLWNWVMHDGLARRVPRNEGTQQKSGRTSKEGPNQSSIQLVTGSNARGLEEDEGDQGSGTSGLSVVDEGVGAEHQEVLDYSMKEHFFSPLNPNNR